MKAKNETEVFFGDFVEELEASSIDTILEQYEKNPFYKTKVNVILCDLDSHLEKHGWEKNPEKGDKDSEEKFETLKNVIGKSNFAYTVKLLEIK